MTNWLVTLSNTRHPFEKKQVVIHADTVVEALGKGDLQNPGYYAYSASFYSTAAYDVPLQSVLSEI